MLQILPGESSHTDCSQPCIVSAAEPVECASSDQRISAQKLSSKESAGHAELQEAYQALLEASQKANAQYESAVNKRRMLNIAEGLPEAVERDEVRICLSGVWSLDSAVDRL